MWVHGLSRCCISKGTQNVQRYRSEIEYKSKEGRWHSSSSDSSTSSVLAPLFTSLVGLKACYVMEAC